MPEWSKYLNRYKFNEIFLDNKLEELLNIFGRRQCKSCIEFNTGTELEEDPRKTRSFPLSWCLKVSQETSQSLELKYMHLMYKMHWIEKEETSLLQESMMNMQRRNLRKRKEDARINIINKLIKRTMKKQIK